MRVKIARVPKAALQIGAGALCAAALGLSVACSALSSGAASQLPSQQAIDAVVRQMMQDTGAEGFAMAVIDDGEVAWFDTWGKRNAAGAPLEADSILYGASLTKMTFGYLVMQLVDAGIVDLDESIAQYLPEPLPRYTADDIEERYARWSDLAGDERWRQLTPRILLNHGSGFANFGFLEPDGKLRLHFDPGARYAYSGDGLMLLQFVLEQGLRLDVGKELQTRLFEPLGMKDTSLVWRHDFAGRAADGWRIDGTPEPHDDRGRVRVAGSMDTTLADMARLVAAIARGALLSTASRKEFARPQLTITSRSQFPTLLPEPPPAQRWPDLAAGIGVVTFKGPQGAGFAKGGHNDSTGNMAVCIEQSRRCVVILGNDLRAEAAIPYLVDSVLGPTGMPWRWEYGDLAPWRPAATTLAP